MCLLSNNMNLIDPKHPDWRNHIFFHTIKTVPQHVWFPELHSHALHPNAWYDIFKDYELMVSMKTSLVREMDEDIEAHTEMLRKYFN